MSHRKKNIFILISIISISIYFFFSSEDDKKVDLRKNIVVDNQATESNSVINNSNKKLDINLNHSNENQIETHDIKTIESEIKWSDVKQDRSNYIESHQEIEKDSGEILSQYSSDVASTNTLKVTLDQLEKLPVADAESVEKVFFARRYEGIFRENGTISIDVDLESKAIFYSIVDENGNVLTESKNIGKLSDKIFDSSSLVDGVILRSHRNSRYALQISCSEYRDICHGTLLLTKNKEVSNIGEFTVYPI